MDGVNGHFCPLLSYSINIFMENITDNTNGTPVKVTSSNGKTVIKRVKNIEEVNQFIEHRSWHFDKCKLVCT